MARAPSWAVRQAVRTVHAERSAGPSVRVSAFRQESTDMNKGLNKGLKKGLGALAAVASLLALGPLAAANAAQPTRTRIDAFANDGIIAVESADGRTDISKHTINAYLLAPYTSAVATGDTLNEYAVSTGTGYADKVTTAVKAAFPDADKGADGWQVALGDATTTLDEANPMDWVARNLLDADAAKFEGKVVVLEYSAKLNRNAVIGGTGNENAVTWTIGSNPQDPASTEKRTDKTHVHILRPHRQDRQRHQGRHRRCREFGVTDKDGKAVRFTKLDDGTYAVADSTDKSALDHITVNSKTLNGGATTIRGLYGGGYTFTEAKAPEGYIGLLLPSFKVSATLDEGSNAAKMAVTDLGASRLVSFDAKADANAGRVTVANAKSLKDLPKTGAAGITLMSSVAAVLMACGAALILSRKHRA